MIRELELKIKKYEKKKVRGNWDFLKGDIITCDDGIPSNS
jgi:hypothetical protein